MFGIVVVFLCFCFFGDKRRGRWEGYRIGISRVGVVFGFLCMRVMGRVSGF